MSRKRIEVKHITREDIYSRTEIPCPICGREVSSFRVALVLKEYYSHSDFLPGKECPICHR